MFKLAIVGRPNVGKSALFNRICNRKIAIVDEMEGVTRDRIYAEAEIFGSTFEVIDTGGIDAFSSDRYREEIRRQAEIAIQEADSIIMVVDGHVGITEADLELSRILLKTSKPVTLAVNKIDAYSHQAKIHDFYSLGISNILGVSALQGYQIAELLEMAWEGFTFNALPPAETRISLSIIGRPNVGKSTLVNAFLDEERCVISPEAGTTRDSIDIPFSYNGDLFTLIDTAGIRRKQAERDAVEKFAAIRTERAIERSDVCLLMLDAAEGLTAQEKKIANQIEEAGKGCILLVNKWDVVKGFRMEHCAQGIRAESPFLAHCPLLFIAAKTKRNIFNIFDHAKSVYQACRTRITTHQLNKFLERAIQINHPPMISGKRLRVYYMTQVTVSPPRFVLFVNKPALMSDTYKRYLINQFREQFDFIGTPIIFSLRGKEPSNYQKSQ